MEGLSVDSLDSTAHYVQVLGMFLRLEGGALVAAHRISAATEGPTGLLPLLKTCIASKPLWVCPGVQLLFRLALRVPLLHTSLCTPAPAIHKMTEWAPRVL